MKKNTKIEVEWNDTHTTAFWGTDASMSKHPLVRCKSIGYFINKDREALRLSHTIQTGEFSGRDGSAIPIGCITKITRLK